MARKRGKIVRRQRHKNFIRAWRKHRGLTLEQLAERIGMTHATLSRVERGLQDYNESMLDAIVEALGAPDAASLLMRNPTDPDAIWSVWDQAKPIERRQIVEIAKTILKTGT